jgi:hypothetical protein
MGKKDNKIKYFKLLVFVLLLITFCCILLYSINGVSEVRSNNLIRVTNPVRSKTIRSNVNMNLNNIIHLPPHNSVCFIIRAHGDYTLQLNSMLWAIASQSWLNANKHNKIYVFVLPTEPQAETILQQHINTFKATQTSNYQQIHPIQIEVTLLNINDAIFQENCCLIHSLCAGSVGDAWREEKLRGGWSLEALTRYCQVNSVLHYRLTDMALVHVLALHDELKFSHVVVTNADNYYLPSFLNTTIAARGSEDFDIIMTVSNYLFIFL